MFKNKVFSYSTEEAVLAGYLVDYDAIKIKNASDRKSNFDEELRDKLIHSTWIM